MPRPVLSQRGVSFTKVLGKRMLFVPWKDPLYLDAHINPEFLVQAKDGEKRINHSKVKSNVNSSRLIAKWSRNSTGVILDCLFYAVFFTNNQNVPEIPTLCSINYVPQRYHPTYGSHL